MERQTYAERVTAAAVAVFSVGFTAIAAWPLGAMFAFATLIDPDLPPDEWTRQWARKVLSESFGLVLFGLPVFGGFSSALFNALRAVAGRGSRMAATRFTLVGAVGGVGGVGAIFFYLGLKAI